MRKLGSRSVSVTTEPIRNTLATLSLERNEWTELSLTAGGCLLLTMSHLTPALSVLLTAGDLRGSPGVIAKGGGGKSVNDCFVLA